MSHSTPLTEIKMPKRATPPITLPEYERLFRTIHAVVAHEQWDLREASLFFAVTGAYLLKRHHKLASATPVAGAAAYNLKPHSPFSLVFGRSENETLVSDANTFHSWIEVDGWVIDLMAPLFEALALAEHHGVAVPQFMFQKPIVADAKAVSLDAAGAYLHLPNDRLATDLMTRFTEKPAYGDLVRVCDQWYVRPPKKIASNIRIADQTGAAEEVALSPIRIAGVW